MTREEAVILLDELIGRFEGFQASDIGSPQFTQWCYDAEADMHHIFAKNDERLMKFTLELNSLRFPGTGYGQLPRVRRQNDLKDFEEFRVLLQSTRREVSRFYQGSPEPQPSDGLILLRSLLRRFDRVVVQLRDRHEGRQTIEVKDEYDVQDLLHSLLVLFFDDIRPEEYTPSYAGSSSRVDFHLKTEGIVIEVKKTRPSLTTAALGRELVLDREYYRQMPDCKRLVCFVYDPARLLQNVAGFISDIECAADDYSVEVQVVPER